MLIFYNFNFSIFNDVYIRLIDVNNIYHLFSKLLVLLIIFFEDLYIQLKLLFLFANWKKKK